MTLTEKLLAYAADFEKTFVDDDWSRLERHFTEDVVYEVVNCPVACRVEGRDAVLAALRKSISGFDRRCDERRLGIRRGPVESGDEIELDWEVAYVIGSAPEFLLLGSSLARFDGERIGYLRDSYPDGMGDEFAAWLGAHAPDWDISYV